VIHKKLACITFIQFGFVSRKLLHSDERLRSKWKGRSRPRIGFHQKAS